MASEEDQTMYSEEDQDEYDSEEVSEEEDDVKSSGRKLIHQHAVQCESCLKWRYVSQEDYEEIRTKLSEERFICNKKPIVSCDDPADLEQDPSRATWAIDRPDIPRTPNGFQRKVIMRKDFSKMDVHYITPHGKKIRAWTEIPDVLKEHPEYNVTPADFSFVAPTILSETVPEPKEKKAAATTSGTKKLKTAP